MVGLNRGEGFGELFADISERRSKSAYFFRVSGYNDTIKNIIDKYYAAAAEKGAIAAGKLPNPDEKQVSYFIEMLGRDFHVDKAFLGRSLGRWLPQLKNAFSPMLVTLSGSVML